MDAGVLASNCVGERGRERGEIDVRMDRYEGITICNRRHEADQIISAPNFLKRWKSCTLSSGSSPNKS